jgi:hypothetical protein
MLISWRGNKHFIDKGMTHSHTLEVALVESLATEAQALDSLLSS